jgi:hypothetical protein
VVVVEAGTVVGVVVVLAPPGTAVVGGRVVAGTVVVAPTGTVGGVVPIVVGMVVVVVEIGWLGPGISNARDLVAGGVGEPVGAVTVTVSVTTVPDGGYR